MKPNHWSTPTEAPLVTPFPFTFRDVEVLTLVYRTTPEAVQRMLPEPLRAVSDQVLVPRRRIPPTRTARSGTLCDPLADSMRFRQRAHGFSSSRHFLG
jgi:hypothetical protein